MNYLITGCMKEEIRIRIKIREVTQESEMHPPGIAVAPG
jgi:hypothetical protein